MTVMSDTVSTSESNVLVAVVESEILPVRVYRREFSDVLTKSITTVLSPVNGQYYLASRGITTV